MFRDWPGGFKSLLVGKHKPSPERLRETYERILLICVRWPRRRTQFVSKSPIQKARGSEFLRGRALKVLV